MNRLLGYIIYDNINNIKEMKKSITLIKINEINHVENSVMGIEFKNLNQNPTSIFEILIHS